MDGLGDGNGDEELERRGVGHGRGRGSWKSTNEQQHVPLRRPHHAGAQIAGSAKGKDAEQSKLDKSLDDIVNSSRLSANAPEFVPKSFPSEKPMQQGPGKSQKYSAQGRLQMARGNPNYTHAKQSQCYPQDYENPQHCHQSNQGQHASQHANAQCYGRYEGGAGDYKARNQDLSGEEDNCMLHFSSTMEQLLNAIHYLILNPGNFSSLVPLLINNIRPCLEYSNQLGEILSVIFQQSINEGNFRYSGARLCTCIDKIVTPAEQATFRETLYALCKWETERQAFKWQQRNEHAEEEQRKCHGMILFLAELVTQMVDTPAYSLGDLLVQLVTVVLKKPAPNSVKHICQALKLAGQSLEKGKKGKKKEMEDMMRALTELVTEGRVDMHVGNMVHSVIELRNGNWGRGSTSSDSTVIDTNETVEPQQTLDEPVFYGPDGKVLSPEENEFLEDVAQSATNNEDHILADQDYGDVGEFLSEDDDDYDREYDEFLNLTKNRVANKAPK